MQIILIFCLQILVIALKYIYGMVSKGEKEYINIIDRDVVEMDYFVKIEIDDFYRKIVEAKKRLSNLES